LSAKIAIIHTAYTVPSAIIRRIMTYWHSKDCKVRQFSLFWTKDCQWDGKLWSKYKHQI